MCIHAVDLFLCGAKNWPSKENFFHRSILHNGTIDGVRTECMTFNLAVNVMLRFFNIRVQTHWFRRVFYEMKLKKTLDLVDGHMIKKVRLGCRMHIAHSFAMQSIERRTEMITKSR